MVIMAITTSQSQDLAWKVLPIPNTIEVHQEIENCPAGWQKFIPQTKHILTTVVVFDGHPSDLASLEPESYKVNKKAKTETTQFSFNPNTNRLIWLSCRYYLTSVQTCISLPPETRELRVHYDDRVPNNSKITKVEYR